MPRIHTPTGFKLQSNQGALFTLSNDAGHSFSIHPVTSGIIRVVHELPSRYPQKSNEGIHWETNHTDSNVEIVGDSQAIIHTSSITIRVEHGTCPRLHWYAKTDGAPSDEPFLVDSATRAYSFDAATGAVIHYVDREDHVPLSEDEYTDEYFLHPDRNEFVYGLGESRGSILKTGKVFTMEGRDAMGFDWEHGDPLYKTNPFYLVYNKHTRLWYGIYYNNLSDSAFDMGAESDALWGSFRSYRANTGPLDYYVILADGTLPSIITAYASLVTPSVPSAPFLASPTLPPLRTFGYLASSLALAADPHAQDAIIDFLTTCRAKGFPVDGLYLSSGWCQNSETGDRNFFVWNKSRYPDPEALGRQVESELDVQVIVNVKPWLLDVHPLYEEASSMRTFVRAAGAAEDNHNAKSWLWSSEPGCHSTGSYIDYSSKGGSEWWASKIREELLAKGLTGLWIDNNEMSGLTDDDDQFAGEVSMFAARGDTGFGDEVDKRQGWNGSIRVGSAGKAINTMGMSRATFEALLASRPNDRPVIATRSAVPGIQAYAHSTWSGDNSTTWKALKWGTKMTLSLGLSFGPGLYGHDIGGFAGKHHPSPELLVRWCQNGAWHTRFTVHSWKEVSTTLWMYDHIPGISDIIRSVLAFRYRLAPTFYSFYVTHYYRKGWPLLKPLLWYHSLDLVTLFLDEEFIFGTHVLVAPVTTKGATSRRFYLPGSFTSFAEEKGTSHKVMWCELDTGKWHEGGKHIELDAPLSRTPTLVRSGGIVVLGGECTRTIYDGISSRTVLIFPAPSPSRSSGEFTLVEDDGRSNAHTTRGIYTEIALSFSAIEDYVEVDYAVVKDAYQLPYDTIWFELPPGDERVIRLKGSSESQEEGGLGFTRSDNGQGRFGARIVIS